jgi:hypothetical protein
VTEDACWVVVNGENQHSLSCLQNARCPPNSAGCRADRLGVMRTQG